MERRGFHVSYRNEPKCELKVPAPPSSAEDTASRGGASDSSVGQLSVAACHVANGVTCNTPGNLLVRGGECQHFGSKSDGKKDAESESESQSQLRSHDKHDKQVDAAQPSCPICLDVFERASQVKVLPGCLHVFHSPCIDKVLRSILFKLPA